MNGVQVRNLYYVKRTSAGSGAPALGTVPGDLQIVDFGAATKNALSGKDGIQLKYTNPDGKIIVSDFIVKGQAAVEATAGTGKALKKAVLALENTPIAGEDYIVDILIHNYVTISDNSTLSKFGAVHATTSMSYQKFMFKLAKSFALNFRRDEAINKFFTFWTGQHGGTFTEIKFDTDWYAYLIAASGGTEDTTNKYELEIREVEQPTWIRGRFPKQTVNFDVAPHTVISNGDEVQPFVKVGESGLVAVGATAAVIPNGYDMADLEYECHGEIGDQIRESAGIRAIPTKYAIADSDVTKTFDTVEITFHYVGRNTSSQKAEKQITLAVDHAGSVSASSLASTIAAKL